jgi:hypothetical protein
MRWEWDANELQAGQRLAVLAIEKVSHGFPASFVGFLLSLALVGVRGRLRFRTGCFGLAALWAAIGKAGLIRLQLELL